MQTTESPLAGQTASGGTDQPVTEQAQEKLQAGADAAREQAQNAKQQAQNAAQQAREQARTQVDQRTTMAGERVTSTASDARSIADQLRSDGKEAPAKLVDQAADHVEQLGSYLTEADPDRMLRDLESFARRKPWAVMAGGLLAGFAASRLVSASSAARQVGPSTGSTPETHRLPAPTGGPTYTGTGTGLPAPQPGGATTGGDLGAGRATGETYGYQVEDPALGVTDRPGGAL